VDGAAGMEESMAGGNQMSVEFTQWQQGQAKFQEEQKKKEIETNDFKDIVNSAR
jgi:hypothetical protein